MFPNHSAVCVWPHSPDYRGSVTGVSACFLEEKKWLFAVQAPQSLKEDEETRRRLTTTWSFNVTEAKKTCVQFRDSGAGIACVGLEAAVTVWEDRVCVSDSEIPSKYTMWMSVQGYLGVNHFKSSRRYRDPNKTCVGCACYICFVVEKPVCPSCLLRIERRSQLCALYPAK